METTNTNRNVLIGVDVQNDFISGSLAVDGGQEVVQPINRVAFATRDTGGQVAFTRDWHPAVTPHFDTWPAHCVAGTDGAEFHQHLDIVSSDIIISKGMGQTDGYSGWEGIADDGTTLEQLVEPRSPEEKVRVFIGGLATDYCVKATALDVAAATSQTQQVDVYLLRDAVRAVNLQAEDEQKALQALAEANVLAISSQEALAMIGPKR